MSIATTEREPRKRRVAADEAHAWARNLKLGNPLAKLVLSMLTLYVNGDGVCIVSVPTLADDCEFAPDTVRRRLTWLEEIGAIVRFPQWIDDKGRRNSDGRGKRTTDLIKLMIDADVAMIEAHALGQEVESDTVSPRHQQGLTDEEPVEVSPRSQQGLNPVSPPLAVCQPSQSGEGLISEPEPELKDSPQAPQAGGGVIEHRIDQEKEPEHFGTFFEGCLYWKTMDRGRALQVFLALTSEEREKAAAASPLHAEECAKAKRKSKDAHKLLAEKFWERYPYAKLPERKPELHFEAEGSQSWRARVVMAAIAGDAKPNAMMQPDGRGLMFRSALTPAQLALAPFAADDPTKWQFVPSGSNECGAWRAFLGIPPRLIVVGYQQSPLDASRHDWPVKKEGLRVPLQWPPRKDGSFDAGEPDSGSAAA